MEKKLLYPRQDDVPDGHIRVAVEDEGDPEREVVGLCEIDDTGSAGEDGGDNFLFLPGLVQEESPQRGFRWRFGKVFHFKPVNARVEREPRAVKRHRYGIVLRSENHAVERVGCETPVEE